jgi:hypothetical protein
MIITAQQDVSVTLTRYYLTCKYIGYVLPDLLSMLDIGDHAKSDAAGEAIQEETE